MKLIAGGSWALGEWHDGHLVHAGFGQYLHDAGHAVVNLAQTDCSNHESYLALHYFLLRNRQLLSSITDIYVVQNDWTLDFPYIRPEDREFLTTAHDLRSRLISRFYYDLISLNTEFNTNIKIHVIGGSVESFYFDNVDELFPGLNIACSSWINLCLNDNPINNNPVFSWWTKLSVPMLNLLKSHIRDSNELTALLADIDAGDNRTKLVASNPEYFWPDGAHPNRKAHRILFDHMVKHNHV